MSGWRATRPSTSGTGGRVLVDEENVVLAFKSLYEQALEPYHHVGGWGRPPCAAPEGWVWIMDCEGDAVCMVDAESAAHWVRLLNADPYAAQNGDGS